MAELEGVSEDNVVVAPGRYDRYRLLNLAVWQERYRVSLRFLLQTLFAYYKQIRRRSRTPGLRITVAALTGIRSRQIIEEAVLATYPSGENFSMARVQDQLRYLGQTNIAIHARNPVDRMDQVAAEYRRRITLRRRAIASGAEKYRRPWRGNPWR